MIIFGECIVLSFIKTISGISSQKLAAIQSCVTLRCYSCHGGKQCGVLFSSKSNDIKLVYGNDLYDSCSVSI
jgi:hypothetical protein